VGHGQVEDEVLSAVACACMCPVGMRRGATCGVRRGAVCGMRRAVRHGVRRVAACGEARRAACGVGGWVVGAA